LIALALVAIGAWVLESDALVWIGVAAFLIGMIARRIAVRRLPPH
jgi:hypothetical protein